MSFFYVQMSNCVFCVECTQTPLFCIFEDSYLKLLMRCKGGKFPKLDFFGESIKDPPYSTGTEECQFKVTRRTAVESA